MLLDTGADVTILKLEALHDNVWIRDTVDDQIELSGISSKIITIGQIDCHMKIGGYLVTHPVHIVPKEFQLDGDGLLGIDFLKHIGAKIDYRNMNDLEFRNNYIKIGKVEASENKKKLIDVSHLTKEEASRLSELTSQYQDVFRKPNQYLTCTDTVKHEITTEADQPPINQRPYRLPEAQKSIVEEHIQEMKRSDVIRESTSPWNSPIVLVPKKSTDGTPKYRLCCDMRRLNEVTKGDAHPLPNISDILDQLGGMTYFSTLDLASGYHQIEIKETDKEKTAFSTPSGHWEYNRMCFGLKKAPACFVRLMNEVSRGLIGKACYVFMDDIICYGKILEH